MLTLSKEVCTSFEDDDRGKQPLVSVVAGPSKFAGSSVTIVLDSSTEDALLTLGVVVANAPPMDDEDEGNISLW